MTVNIFRNSRAALRSFGDIYGVKFQTKYQKSPQVNLKMKLSTLAFKKNQEVIRGHWMTNYSKKVKIQGHLRSPNIKNRLIMVEKGKEVTFAKLKQKKKIYLYF